LRREARGGVMWSLLMVKEGINMNLEEWSMKIYMYIVVTMIYITRGRVGLG
jgi:hypothetical protein